MKPRAVRSLCERLLANDPDLSYMVLDLEDTADEDLEWIFDAMKQSTCYLDNEGLFIDNGTLSVRAAFSLASTLQKRGGVVGLLQFTRVRIVEFSAIALALTLAHDNGGGIRLCFDQCDITAALMDSLRCLLKADVLSCLSMKECNHVYGQHLILSGSLRNNKNLFELIISDRNRPATLTPSFNTIQDIALLFRGNDCIQALDLSQVALDSRAVGLIAEAAERHRNLQVLTLSGRGSLDTAASQSIANMLMNAPYIYQLELIDFVVEIESMRRLAGGLRSDRSSLQWLTLNGNEIGDEEICILGKVLRTNQNLKTLWLTGNNIGNRGASALAALLKKNILEDLGLAVNEVGSEGAMALADALGTNTSLKDLVLMGNPIDDDGAVALAEVLTRNSTLRHCAAGGFGKRGLAAFIESLPDMLGLLRLCFDSDIRDFTCEVGYELVEALEHNVTLQHVDLYEDDEPVHHLATEIAPKVNHLLALNRGGRRILKSPTAVPASLWPLVLGKSSDNMDVLFHFVREKADVLFQRTGVRKRNRSRASRSSRRYKRPRKTSAPGS